MGNSFFGKCRQYTLTDKFVQNGCYPYFQPIDSAAAGEVTVRGRNLLMMGSNSYLGLHHDPRVIKAAVAATRRYGTGCAGSRFLNGSLDLHEELEQALAELVGKQACLVFSTGYQANVGVIAALVCRGEYAVIDKLDHASIIDGCRLSQGTMVRFRHNDTASLARALTRTGQANSLVIVDGVFSMEGDVVDLPSVVDLAQRHGAAVMVDEAHALGVLHESGAGTARHFDLTSRVDLIMGTFSKSLASNGGFVAGDAGVIHYIKHHARSLIFSTSLSPASAAAALAALRIMKDEPERIEALWRNREFLARELIRMGFDIGRSATPILPLHLGQMETVAQAWKHLRERGMFVNVVVPPAVPPNDCLIRCSVTATHTKEQLCQALEAFEGVSKELAALSRGPDCAGIHPA